MQAKNAGPETFNRLFLVALPVAILLSACDDRECIPARVRARDAVTVDATELDESGLLHARLTARGKPLGGRDMHFQIERRTDVLGNETEWVWVSTEQTGKDGWATTDLKQRDPGDVVKDLRSTHWRASFAGTARYCSGSASASIRPAKLPEPTAKVAPVGPPPPPVQPPSIDPAPIPSVLAPGLR